MSAHDVTIGVEVTEATVYIHIKLLKDGLPFSLVPN